MAATVYTINAIKSELHRRGINIGLEGKPSLVMRNIFLNPY